MEFESLYARVNGLNMHYVTAGEGPPVILLHGFPDTHQIWRRQIPVLAAAGLRIIAPNLRGPQTIATSGLSQKLRFWYMLLFKMPVVAEALLKAGNWAAIRQLSRSREGCSSPLQIV